MLSPETIDAHVDRLHWRSAGDRSGEYRPHSRILVLVPDLTLDGGVTHYYRTLQLDSVENIDYFFVNKPNTRTRLDKTLHAFGIFAGFLLRVGRYSLIHVNPSLNPNSFYRDWFFIVAAKLTGRKVLVYFRGWDPVFEARVRDNPLLNRLFRWTYGRADRVVTLGDTFRRRLLNLGLDPHTPVHVDTTVAGSEHCTEPDTGLGSTAAGHVTTCLFLSRVLREKGVFTAIDTVAKCNETLNRIAVRLVVAGQGPDLDAARRYARLLEWAQVDFVGEVRDDVKAELLKRADILLFPTRYGEGLPNSVLEAMLSGMVIVTRNAGAIPEVVKSGDNGLVTDSNDPRTFADYIVGLVNDPSLAARIAARNRSDAGAFTTESVRARLLNTYGMMLAGDGRGA